MKVGAPAAPTLARFATVDVFCSAPFLGNPVAVVVGADGLDTGAMQRIAAWTKLSETAFVLRPTTPDAQWRLRIFDPVHELVFAGHPSVGTAHALRELGMVAVTHGRAVTLAQECAAGVLPVHFAADGTIWVRTPDATVRPCVDPDAITAALGVDRLAAPPVAVDLGATWVVAELADADTVAALDPVRPLVEAVATANGTIGITAFGAGGPAGCSYEVRSFAPSIGIDEDPVCGSGNAAIAAALAHTGRLAGRDWIAAQGAALGRAGRVGVRIGDDEAIWIGGQCVTTVTGTVRTA